MADLTETQCCCCGVEFAIPKVMYRRCYQQGADFCCPNGHIIGWSKGDGENARLRRKLERAKQNAAYLEEQVEAARRRESAAKGQLTKHKKRSSAGTCPCCKRTFANMAQHMKRQHPEFVKEGGTKVVPIKKSA